MKTLAHLLSLAETLDVVGYNTAIDILFDLSIKYGIDPHAPRNN